MRAFSCTPPFLMDGDQRLESIPSIESIRKRHVGVCDQITEAELYIVEHRYSITRLTPLLASLTDIREKQTPATSPIAAVNEAQHSGRIQGLPGIPKHLLESPRAPNNTPNPSVSSSSQHRTYLNRPHRPHRIGQTFISSATGFEGPDHEDTSSESLPDWETTYEDTEEDSESCPDSETTYVSGDNSTWTLF